MQPGIGRVYRQPIRVRSVRISIADDQQQATVNRIDRVRDVIGGELATKRGVVRVGAEGQRFEQPPMLIVASDQCRPCRAKDLPNLVVR